MALGRRQKHTVSPQSETDGSACEVGSLGGPCRRTGTRAGCGSDPRLRHLDGYGSCHARRIFGQGVKALSQGAVYGSERSEEGNAAECMETYPRPRTS